MKLNLISLCLGAMLAPCLTMASTVSIPGSNSAPDITAGFEATGDDGTLSKTMTFKGDIFNAKANWAWKLGDKELSTPSGENILELDSSAFLDSSVTLGSISGNAIKATVTPTEQIPILIGMTRRPYQSGGVNTRPNVAIKTIYGNYTPLSVAGTSPYYSISISGTASKGAVSGVANLYLVSRLAAHASVCNTGTGCYNKPGAAIYENNSGYVQVGDTYSNWKASVGANGDQGGSSGWKNYPRNILSGVINKTVSGYWQSNIAKLEIMWNKGEIPEAWTMPVEVKITMI